MTGIDPSAALADGQAWKGQVHRWQLLLQSGALPKHVKTPQQAIAIAMQGAELGWPPMRSLRSIYIVDGRPELAAEAMLALIYERCPSAIIEVVEQSDQRCCIRGRRSDKHVPIEVDFTIENAQRGGLLNKENWKRYPSDMLWARAVSRLRRRVFPDVGAGCFVEGEVSDASRVVHVEPVVQSRLTRPSSLAAPADVEPAADVTSPAGSKPDPWIACDRKHTRPPCADPACWCGAPVEREPGEDWDDEDPTVTA